MLLIPVEKMRRYRLKLKENEDMQNKVKKKDRKDSTISWKSKEPCKKISSTITSS